MPRPDEVKELLRCMFSPEELAEKSRELAGSIQRQITAKEEKVAVMADFKERIDREGALVGKLSRDINNGWEVREVVVDVYYNSPNIGMKEFVRRDTSELVRNASMTNTELQSTLPFEQMQKHLEQTAAATREAASKQYAHEVRITKFEDGNAKAQCLNCEWSEGGPNKKGEIEEAAKAHSDAHGYLPVADPVQDSIDDSENAAKKFFGLDKVGPAEILDPTEPEPAGDDDGRLDPEDDDSTESLGGILENADPLGLGIEPKRPDGVRTYEEARAETQDEHLVICGAVHPEGESSNTADLCRLGYLHENEKHMTADGRVWVDGDVAPHTPNAKPAGAPRGTRKKK